jgi:hypothetical protein
MDMIELTYFSQQETGSPVYQVIQFNPGEPWQLVNGDEVIGTVDKQHGLWNLRSWSPVPEGLVTGIGQLIENQHFNRLPALISQRWSEYVQQVVVVSDREYLVICTDGIDLEHFEKLFRGSVSELVKDEWRIRFRVYDALMSADFELLVN